MRCIQELYRSGYQVSIQPLTHLTVPKYDDCRSTDSSDSLSDFDSIDSDDKVISSANEFCVLL